MGECADIYMHASMCFFYVEPRGQHQVHFSIVLHIIFWDSHPLSPEFAKWLNWLDSEPQGCSSLFLPSAGITGTRHCIWILISTLEMGPCAGKESASSTVLSPQLPSGDSGWKVGSCELLDSNNKINWFKLVYLSTNLKGRVDPKIHSSSFEYIPTMNEAPVSILRGKITQNSKIYKLLIH